MFGCYADYFAATPSIAIDPSGRMAVAYTFSKVAKGEKNLYVRTSSDGAHWSAPTLINPHGDSNFPQIASGSSDDFSLAWQDDRTGEFNTWYTRSTNGGSTWGAQVRLSNLGTGAPYKSSSGYTFTDGDYFGIAVSRSGITHAIWGEGLNYDSPGSIWYSRGR